MTRKIPMLKKKERRRAGRAHSSPSVSSTNTPSATTFAAEQADTSVVPGRIVAQLAKCVSSRDMQRALKIFGKWRDAIASMSPSSEHAALLLDCAARLLDRDSTHIFLVRDLLDRFDRASVSLLEEAMRLDLADGIVALHREQFSRGIERFDLVMKNADRTEHLELMASSLYYLARCYYKSGDYISALALANRAHDKSSQLGYPRTLALIDMVKAWILFVQGRERAEAALDDAASVLWGTDHVEDANILSFRGRIACHKGDYSTALEKFRQAIEKFNDNDDPRHPNLARCYVHRAFTSLLLARQLETQPHSPKDRAKIGAEVTRLREEASEWLGTAEGIYGATDHDRHRDRLARMYYVRAVSFFDTGNFQEALQITIDAQRNVAAENRVLMIQTRILQCRCLNMLEEPALEMAMETRRLAEKTDSRRLKIRACICLGVTFLKEQYKNVPAARQCLEEATTDISPLDGDYLRTELDELEEELTAAETEDKRIIEVTNLLVQAYGLAGTLELVEKEIVRRSYQSHRNNVNQTARALATTRNRVKRILKSKTPSPEPEGSKGPSPPP